MTAVSESIENTKNELCMVRKMIKNVRTGEVFTDFDVAWALMNAVDNDAYVMVKYHLEKMKHFILVYTVRRMKAVEMKLKDTGTSITKSAHKRREQRRNDDRRCYHCGRKRNRFYCDDWFENTDAG